MERLYWYAWDNHEWVSLHTTERDSKTLTDAGRAYETISKWLAGARVEKREVFSANDDTPGLARAGRVAPAVARKVLLIAETEKKNPAEAG